MYFSKSKVLAGLQCEKQLYLRVHHPELAEQSDSPATLTGYVVEAYARKEFPGAVLVERDTRESNPYAATEQLLKTLLLTRYLRRGYGMQIWRCLSMSCNEIPQDGT